MKFSCKVDKSSNRSSGAAFSSTYEQFLFSVLLGDLPLFLSIFSSFYGAVPRERIEDRRRSARDPRFIIIIPSCLTERNVRRIRKVKRMKTSNAAIACVMRAFAYAEVTTVAGNRQMPAYLWRYNSPLGLKQIN